MAKRLLVMAFIGSCLFGAAVYLDASPEENEPKKVQPENAALTKVDRPLTVEQTLGLVFTRAWHAPVMHLFRNANPGAKEKLYQILENDELAEFHEGVWVALGYMGDESDLKRLEKSLWNDYHGVLQGRPHPIPAMFKAIGLMVARDVEGAQEVANKMMTPDYWEDAPFRWSSEKPPKQPDFVYYTLYRFMLGYSLSLDPDMQEKVEDIRERIGKPDERKLGSYFTREDFFNPDTLTKMLLANGQNQRAGEDRPVTNGERRELLSHFDGDLQNPGPARPPRNPNSISFTPVPGGTAPRQRPPETPTEELKRIAYRYYLDAEGKLEAIEFHGETINNQTLKLLEAVPTLRSLSLVRTAVTDEGLEQLKVLQQLERLSISRTEKITDQGLEVLKDLNTLTGLLLLYAPNVTDTGLVHLTSLKKLEYLNLHEVNITDTALSYLKGLRSLKKLHISNARITGSGLEHLRGLRNLEELLLEGVPLTDAGLEKLEGFDHLERLALGKGAQFSRASLQELKQSLPETEITFVGELPR